MANHGLNRKEQLRRILGSNRNLAMELNDGNIKHLIDDMEKRLNQSGGNDNIISGIRKQYLQVLNSGNLGSGEAAEEFKKEMNEFFDVTVVPYNTVVSASPRRLQQDNSRIESMEEKLKDQERKLKEKDRELKLKDEQLEMFKKEKDDIWNRYDHQMYELKKGLDEKDDILNNMKQQLETHEDAMRLKDKQMKELIADKDDLRHRLCVFKQHGGKIPSLEPSSSVPSGGQVSGKLAGVKLTDLNPDIADLSDPNRAMKLSEKFGDLYDDQWTDAYEHLIKKNMTTKDTIALLLDVLQKCEAFCCKLKETQMDSLRNVLLHPKEVAEPRKRAGGLNDHARMKADDQKAVRELRRQIGVREGVLDEVKQVFIQEIKSWRNKKYIEGCTPYLQRCAEICWLMVLHDPPLYMKMDVQRGDPLDSSLYSVYSASGDKIDFLVWPPLFNNQGGGLLSKGTAEPMKVVKKT